MSKQTRDRFEDLEWLLDMGEHPDRAATRVGWTAKTATRLADRHGLRALAARLREGIA